MQFHSQPTRFVSASGAPSHGVSPRPEAPHAAIAFADLSTAPARAFTNLTPRQMAVLVLVAQGKPNKTIARDLCIARETVKKHLSAVFERLQIANRAQAMLLVWALGGPEALRSLMRLRECETTVLGDC